MRVLLCGLLPTVVIVLSQYVCNSVSGARGCASYSVWLEQQHQLMPVGQRDGLPGVWNIERAQGAGYVLRNYYINICENVGEIQLTLAPGR
jgi:hypothetical protein